MAKTPAPFLPKVKGLPKTSPKGAPFSNKPKAAPKGGKMPKLPKGF